LPVGLIANNAEKSVELPLEYKAILAKKCGILPDEDV